MTARSVAPWLGCSTLVRTDRVHIPMPSPIFFCFFKSVIPLKWRPTKITHDRKLSFWCFSDLRSSIIYSSFTCHAAHHVDGSPKKLTPWMTGCTGKNSNRQSTTCRLFLVVVCTFTWSIPQHRTIGLSRISLTRVAHRIKSKNASIMATLENIYEQIPETFNFW